MTIADVMTREFEVVQESATLLQAMRHLRDCPLVEDEIGIKCVVVLDGEDKLVGVLTQSDVVGEILFPYFVRDLASTGEVTTTMQDEDFAKLAVWAGKVKVKDVMSRNPHTLSTSDDLFRAADAIVSKKVKSLPVLDRKGAVAGIVYRSTLYRRIAESILDHSAPVPGKLKAES